MIKNLKDCAAEPAAGNKAQNLARITDVATHTAAGIVIGYDEQDEQRINKAIDRFCSKNKRYAVRSSSNIEDGDTYSYAGMFESYLGVEKKNVFQKVMDVRASVGTKRLKALQKTTNQRDANVGVIIQEMIPSSVSGICFTRDPLSNENCVVIEAGIGLGEYIVQNNITPDRYVVRGNSIDVFLQTQHKALISNETSVEEIAIFSHTQKLSDAHIFRLAKEAQKLENHLGYPCDIEWGLFENRIYILQVRPIVFA